MGKNRSKVAIIGAGFVGASAAFALSLNQMVSELVLIDVAKEKAAGEAMDINHGLSFLGQMKVYDGDYSDVADCDVIVITAGANRKPGETRIDLAKKNVAIAKEITSNIMKYYTRGVILVVANPVDVLTYKIQKWSGLPAGRVLGTGTVLDSSRFRYLLSEKFDVDVRNVHGYIIGEHGDSQLPLWSATHIAGKNINEYFADPAYGISEADKEAIMVDVKTAGAEIIKRKGATYYAIAVSINTILESLLKDQNTIRTVSTVINGNYGIEEVALSLPSIVNSNGVKSIVDLKLADDELAALKHSAEQLKIVLNEVKDI
ncbi:MAG TPA: L-lactate dehydrogenase [Pseudobacteroides sp.]|uniref:L-lactate dehydrogenase n=1 Tax=Pseudobacteroides sp. TaxID=1968840 RepID=UPI002F922A1A